MQRLLPRLLARRQPEVAAQCLQFPSPLPSSSQSEQQPSLHPSHYGHGWCCPDVASHTERQGCLQGTCQNQAPSGVPYASIMHPSLSYPSHGDGSLTLFPPYSLPAPPGLRHLHHQRRRRHHQNSSFHFPVSLGFYSAQCYHCMSTKASHGKDPSTQAAVPAQGRPSHTAQAPSPPGPSSPADHFSG
ncbi:hypothetical protein DUNSADRAFT_17788, partial [Dunaliella salina]